MFFRVWVFSGFWVQGSQFFRVEGSSGFRVFVRVWGSGFKLRVLPDLGFLRIFVLQCLGLFRALRGI